MLAACRKHAVWILQAAVTAGNNPTGDEAQAAWITLDVTHTHTHTQSASWIMAEVSSLIPCSHSPCGYTLPLKKREMLTVRNTGTGRSDQGHDKQQQQQQQKAVETIRCLSSHRRWNSTHAGLLVMGTSSENIATLILLWLFVLAVKKFQLKTVFKLVCWSQGQFIPRYSCCNHRGPNLGQPGAPHPQHSRGST